jgi:hypothetical protein
MPLPPEWLFQWTQYIALVVGIITGVVALWKGGEFLRYKIMALKKSLGVE